MATLRFTTKLAGVLADVDSVVLSDPTATYGVKRNDTGDTVVAAGTAMTKGATGTYTYTFAVPAGSVQYTIWFKPTIRGTPHHFESLFRAKVVVPDTTVYPSRILWQYLTDAAVFDVPGASGATWPLFRDHLPDTPDNAAAISDTAGVIWMKGMDATVLQRYGLQLRVRSRPGTNGHDKLAGIIDGLDSVHDDEVVYDGNTYLIQNISRFGTLATMGTEPGTKRRMLYAQNLLVTMKQV